MRDMFPAFYLKIENGCHTLPEELFFFVLVLFLFKKKKEYKMNNVGHILWYVEATPLCVL